MSSKNYKKDRKPKRGGCKIYSRYFYPFLVYGASIASIISLIFSIYAFEVSNISFSLIGELQNKNLNKTEEVYSLVVNFPEKFSNITTALISVRCTKFSTPVLNNGSLYVGSCIKGYYSKNIDLSGEGYKLFLKFRSNWFLQEKLSSPYLLDFVSAETNAKLSLFVVKSGMLILRYSTGDEAHSVSIPLKEVNWKDDFYTKDWNIIEISWDKEGYLYLSVNGVKRITKFKSTHPLILGKCRVYLGSDSEGIHSANGYFDDFLIGYGSERGFSYTVGPIEGA